MFLWYWLSVLTRIKLKSLTSIAKYQKFTPLSGWQSTLTLIWRRILSQNVTFFDVRTWHYCDVTWLMSLWCHSRMLKQHQKCDVVSMMIPGNWFWLLVNFWFIDDVRVINPQVWKSFALKLLHKLELCQSNDMFRLYNQTLNPQGSLSCLILIQKVSSGRVLWSGSQYSHSITLSVVTYFYAYLHNYVCIKLDCNL